MAFILFIFFVAAAISSVAAYFSLVGLGSIFAATFWGVVIMGAALEVGKIVTTKWVHANWQNPQAPWYFRGLLCFFVACLMAITSLGIYGYLSRGHLEQQAPLAGLGIQVAQLETQLKQKQTENEQLQTRLGQISRITDKSLESSGKAALRAANSQKKESADIQKRIDANNTTINELTTKLVPLKMKTGDVQGELGVAKFIAEAAGWAPEKAIRIIISLIMAAFDPLALSMFIMGSISLKKLREDKARKDEPLVEAIPTGIETKLDTLKPDWVEYTKTDEFKEKMAQLERDADEAFLQRLQSYHDSEQELVGLKEEHEARLAQLEAAQAAIDKEREEFETAMADVQKNLDIKTADVEKQGTDLHLAREVYAQDQEALKHAHQQLVDLEARINDERELLGQWEQQLKDQQAAINSWKPEGSSVEDNRSPKEMIIEVLEMNPEIVNDIVQVVEAMRANRPGL